MSGRDPWVGAHLGIGGECVVVTGAAGLIGGAIVARILGLGGSVVAIDRSTTNVGELEGHPGPGTVRVLSRDVTSESDIDAIIADVEDLRPRMYVHAAGWQVPDGRTRMPAADEWAAVFAVHVTAPALLTTRLFANTHDRGLTGSAVFLSSVHEEVVFGDPSYAAAKGALRNVVRELAAIAADHGSRVNAVAPGHVGAATAESPPTRLGQRAIPPDSISAAVAFLLCDGCSPHTTGATLLVDAGLGLNDPWTRREPPRRRRWWG